MPVHRLSADPRRRVRPGHPGRWTTRSGPAASDPPPAAVPTKIDSAQGRYVRPPTLDEALDLLAENPDARLVAGSTDWGVELNIRHARAR